MNRIDRNRNDYLIVVLLLMQPILDIISFWAVEYGYTAFTTVLRFGIFGIIMLYAFWMSKNKKVYLLLALVIGVFWILHMVVVMRDGYLSWYQDVAMLLRTIQLPALTIAFITIFKNSKRMPMEIGQIFVCNYIVISISILISYLVGRPEYTYETGIGIKGWFYMGNAQSCILAVMAFVALYHAYQKNNVWYFLLVTILIFGNLYFFGTRVAYYTIFILSFTFIVIMLWNCSKRWKIYLILIIGVMVCGITYTSSPCYKNQFYTDISVTEWNQTIADIEKETSEEDDDELSLELYNSVYRLYCEDLVERFGLLNVMEQYDRTLDASQLMNNRNLKISFGNLVMEESDLLTHLFGVEYMDFYYNGETFEPENDFPSIYYLYGYVGLFLYCLFIAYFVLKLCIYILKNFKRIPFLHSVLAITLILSLGIAQYSGHVLRRPNVTIFISVLFAYTYCICGKKENSDEVKCNHTNV